MLYIPMEYRSACRFYWLHRQAVEREIADMRARGDGATAAAYRYQTVNTLRWQFRALGVIVE